MERTPHAPRTRAIAALALLLAALAALAPAPARAESGVPVLSARLWTTPDRAARGDVVSYEIMVDNTADARATRVRAVLPFSTHMKVVKVQFDNKSTWVSELAADEITVMFGRMAGGESRRAKVFFQLGPEAPDGLQVRVRATVRYDGDGDTRVRSNYTTLTVGGQEADTAPAATLEPAAAPAGALLRLRVRNYFPEERISTWINAADRVIETRVAADTDGAGAAEMDLGTRDLAPGSYSLVVYGSTSTITTVIPFTILP